MRTTTLLPRLAAFCHRRRRAVLLCWIVLTIASIGLAKQYGGPAATELGAGSSQSSQALALLRKHFPEQAADTLPPQWNCSATSTGGLPRWLNRALPVVPAEPDIEDIPTAV
jgi:RND superfamily putative drug exporter